MHQKLFTDGRRRLATRNYDAQPLHYLISFLSPQFSLFVSWTQHMKLFLLLSFILQGILVVAQAPSPLVLNGTFSPDLSLLKSGKEGEIFPFVNDQTVPGVWSNQPQYISSDGSSNPGGLYSFGPTGSPARGLGTICSNSKRTVLFGVSFMSNETISVLNITVEYEQFRYGGFNETTVLNFDFLVCTMQEYQNGQWGGSGNTVGWIPSTELSFQSLVNTTSNIPPGPLTGYTKTVSVVLPISVPQEMVLQVRWMARALRDGVGVTSVQISIPSSPTSSPTPSPSPPPSPPPSNPTPPPATTTGSNPSPNPNPTPGPTLGPNPSPTPTPTPMHGSNFYGWRFWAIVGGATAVTLGVVGAAIFALIRRRNSRHRYERVDKTPDNPENPLEPPYPPIAQMVDVLKSGTRTFAEEGNELDQIPASSSSLSPSSPLSSSLSPSIPLSSPSIPFSSSPSPSIPFSSSLSSLPRRSPFSSFRADPPQHPPDHNCFACGKNID